MLNEAIVAGWQERKKVPLEEKKKLLPIVMNKIKNGEFDINLKSDRVEDIEYIARKLKDNDLRKLIYFASGLAFEGELPDFDERMHAVKMLQNDPKTKKKIEGYCKTELANYLLNKKGYPFMDNNGYHKTTVIFKTQYSATEPYVKFSFNNGKLTLISCHDSKFSNLKKSMNDTTSYKIGPRDTMKKVKENMKKADFDIKEEKYFSY